MNPDLHRPFLVRLGRAFVYAVRGVAIVSHDRMFRCQFVVAVVVEAMAAWLGISPVEWALLSLTICLVLSLEAMNSAIESAVDLAMPEQHPLAARAKDVAAGAVLLASFGAVAVGLIVLGPRLFERLHFVSQ